MLMVMCLPKFDVKRDTVASDCFKSHTNSWYPDFFQKKVFLMFGLKFTLCNLTSFPPDNLSSLKEKLYSGLLHHLFFLHQAALTCHSARSLFRYLEQEKLKFQTKILLWNTILAKTLDLFSWWQVEVLLWMVEIFIMTGQDFYDDRSRFLRWEVEILIACWYFTMNSSIFHNGRSRYFFIVLA